MASVRNISVTALKDFADKDSLRVSVNCFKNFLRKAGMTTRMGPDFTRTIEAGNSDFVKAQYASYEDELKRFLWDNGLIPESFKVIHREDSNTITISISTAICQEKPK